MLLVKIDDDGYDDDDYDDDDDDENNNNFETAPTIMIYSMDFAVIYQDGVSKFQL